MIQLVDIFSRWCRWCCRFRKRQGYGIHSPFAFNLVSGVIYEQGEYYAYEELSKLRNRSNVVQREKDDRLLFRLVNNFMPSNGLVVSSRLGITYDYIKAGRTHADWHSVSAEHPDALHTHLEQMGQLDFLYVDDPCHTQRILQEALPFVHDHTLIIVRNIRHNAALHQIWKLFIQDSRVRVTFDLHDFGLIYFEKRLNKEDYIINYF